MASTELSLECKVQSYSMLLKYSFGDQQLHTPAAVAGQSYDKLQDFVSCLEEERLKIDVFKRELPLCMQLLTNAVETSRRQLQACKTIQAPTPKPVLEEFMPLKNSTPAEDKNPATITDKANWMTSVQLWSQASDATKHQSTPNHESPSKQDSNNSETSNHRVINNNNSNGAFLPYSGPRAAAEKVPEMELLEKAPNNCGDHKSGNNIIDGGEEQRDQVGFLTQSTPSCTTSSNANSTSQTHRKARRCWSPDLHRRFVSALQMLGGSQVATPKQIRELMKVDGLTNDEVKSHLQKYRLHTRRPGPTPQVASGPPPAQLVVFGALGGLWVPPEYAAAQNGALYGPPQPTSHQPSHFYTPPAVLPQEFYTRTPHHLQHPSLQHHQMQLFKGATPQTGRSSPESEARGTGERSESFEEEKSGSSSWRIEGGENGDERIKRRRSRSEEGGESNRSEITLKF